MFANYCHNVGNLNVLTGLTLLTRQPIDTGACDIDIYDAQLVF